MFHIDNETIDALVMQIAVGKTNGNKTLYGRVIRHKDPEHCAFGGLGLYLLSRFHLAQETLDFSSNRTWFDVKLLVESGSKDNTKSISDDTYRRVMTSVFSS